MAALFLMKSTLTICPSIRPDKLELMLESFFKNTWDSDIIFFTEEGSITKFINQGFDSNPYYKYYHITNDDFIYHTEGWDERFRQRLKYKPGVCCANDLYLKGVLPVAPFISGNIVRCLGWLQMPKLYHLCGDVVWKIIGERIDSYHYFSDIVIEHNHPFRQDKKIEKDDVFNKTNSRLMYKKDHEALREWIAGESYEQIEKIKTELDL